MLGIKQDALATELGEDWTQKKVSLLEQKEDIQPHILELVAKALKVSAEAIKNFDVDAAVNVISNTITNYDNSSVVGHYNLNPIEKIVELYESKIELYERMLKDKTDMINKLEKIISTQQ